MSNPIIAKPAAASASKKKVASRKKSSSRKVSSKKAKKQRRVSPKPLPKKLKSTEVFEECSSSYFRFNSTKNISSSDSIISQDRAVRAIHVGLGIEQPGYNIYVAGITGTGKTSIISSYLEKFSSNRSKPFDWIYVYNFDKPEYPKALKLPAGGGKKLKKEMANLLNLLKDNITKAMHSEDYENTINSFIAGANEKKNNLFSTLEKYAKKLDFQVKSTQMGIETIPIKDGVVLTDKEYSKLKEKERKSIETRRATLEPAVLEFARKVRKIDANTDEYIQNIRTDLGESVVGGLISPLLANYKTNEEITEYLEDVRENVVENLLDFVETRDIYDSEGESMDSKQALIEQSQRFRKYEVNLFIDNSKAKNAPVIIENNPTFYNLFGRVEKNVEYGMYRTDFTMIKPGAFHKANGGYLVLNAADIFRHYNIWEPLKRVLKNQMGYIEDMGEQQSLLPTSGLRPEPIPLDMKVIMIGSDSIYHFLYEEDDEFSRIFKIKADFDYKMPKSKKTVNAYAQFIANRASKESLSPFTKTGVCAIVEVASRLVDHQKYISTQFGKIKDLIIEANFIASEQGARIVSRDHVEMAIIERDMRVSLVEEQMNEMITSNDYLLNLDSDVVGQVNALTVYDYADYSFGRVARLTCSISASDEGVLNIDRAVKLTGKIHEKSVYILTGFINALLARKDSIGLTASVVFEQSYGMIDGDSASIAELTAIFSAASSIPIRQNFAVTGSLNQFGEVQPIGGVNEKIEGFYKTCKLIGRSKNYSVIIPSRNKDNLMLNKETREAVKSGYLQIYPVEYYWQAFELLTGKKFGCYTIYDKEFQKNSCLDIIEHRLENLNKD